MNGVLQTMVKENRAVCGVVVKCGFPIKKLLSNNIKLNKILKNRRKYITQLMFSTFFKYGL